MIPIRHLPSLIGVDKLYIIINIEKKKKKHTTARDVMRLKHTLPMLMPMLMSPFWRVEVRWGVENESADAGGMVCGGRAS